MRWGPISLMCLASCTSEPSGLELPRGDLSELELKGFGPTGFAQSADEPPRSEGCPVLTGGPFVFDSTAEVQRSEIWLVGTAVRNGAEYDDATSTWFHVWTVRPIKVLRNLTGDLPTVLDVVAVSHGYDDSVGPTLEHNKISIMTINRGHTRFRGYDLVRGVTCFIQTEDSYTHR
jgi:hypothetical protein